MANPEHLDLALLKQGVEIWNKKSKTSQMRGGFTRANLNKRLVAMVDNAHRQERRSASEIVERLLAGTFA